MRDFPVTTALVAINLAVFVGMVVTGASILEPGTADIVRWGANDGRLTLGGQYWRLVTAAFVHIGILHIAFNMWCLWSLGQVSERLFGRVSTAVLYVLTGVGGSLLSLAYRPYHIEAGASGAIFGLAGAILIGVKFGHLSISAGQKKSIISSLIFFIILNFSFGFMGRTDNMCHLGGFVSGLIIGLPLASSLSSSATTNRIMQAGTLIVAALLMAAGGKQLVNAHGRPARLVLAEYQFEKQDFNGAIATLQKAVAADPNDADAHGFLGDAYRATGQIDKAIAEYKRALELNPDDGDSRTGLEQLQQSTK